MAYNESLAIFPATSPSSPYLSKSDLNHINSDMQTIIDNINSEMQTMNEKISAMLQKLTDTGSKTNKHEEQLTEISLKL